jgi:hypothetical protein
MSDLFLHQIAPRARWSQARQLHPAVVKGCVGSFSDESIRETLWEPPSYDEWRMAMLVIAKQAVVHIAGYRNHEDFTRDGCRFAWDVINTSPLGVYRDHWLHAPIKGSMRAARQRFDGLYRPV